MLKESSTSRTLGRNTSRNPQFEANENEFEVSQNLNSYPPPRTPLNSIPDPSQCQKESQESEVNSHYKLEAIRPGRSSDKRFEASSDRLGNLGFNYGTPRVLGRNGKAQSEPNSAQSTPARNASRVSLGGAVGFCAGSRVPYSGGGKAGSSGTFLKGISVANSELCKEVQHFELKEDPSFWMDHNVQVLIRIRPLNNIEKLSEGYDRCLRQESAQTLVWVGHPETRFTFDHIACETLSQENLFRVAGVPMVENCLSGYNSCMFAYGQTGSGKTYTMMGEIKETEGHLTEDSGITPRVFDYLFTRIKAEEESRRDDKLCYSCKCSFLEIYNEQIADLLEPSSTNLQLREDMKKGVYVENLTERSVGTVNDVLKLLLQGTANRKVAATHMNCKSSRSHSVFTCTIESRWEKDSMTHFRFARLNLVDLAGSERQKSSGADSERLKEAANINKSLSTLGLVIMTLVDLTHGKPRHVPYRDSRLTFLLQDSLGGNSKTMIIANVSPSICSANETLSTLKFAQRAKLIQNNAKVNEDASGDVNALQWQIQQLKGQLSFLIKHNNFPSLVSNLESNSEIRRLSESSEGYGSFIEKATAGHKLCVQNKEIKCMKAALLGALRREKMAETTIKNLQAEIERMNCLALQKEEDTQHTAFKLRLCKEKIKQLELLVDGALSAEKYLLEENRTLQEQVEELQARIDSNPESTRLALENDRILHHLQQFQNFYEHGERERLLTELSELRDQLVVNLQEKITFSMQNENQDNDTKQELEDCQIMNSNLLRDVDRLQTQLGKYVNSDRVKSDSVLHYSFELPDELQKTDKCSLVDAISLKSDFGDDMSSYTWETDGVLASKIEGQEVLEAKLEKMNKDLEEVKLLNDQYQEKWALQLSQKHQIESVCEEVEMETTRTILHLQEEIAGLQSDLEGRLSSIAQENTELRNMVATKEEDIRTLCSEWERAILELTTFLLDGSRSLKDACGQAESITCSFPEVNARISEHIGMAVRSYIEKEETIQQLQSSLEEAQKMLLDMELKISSLKDATVALSAFQQLQNNQGNEDNGDSIQLRMLLNEKTNMVRMLENEVKYKNDQLSKAEKQAEAAILLVKWLCDSQNVVHTNNDERDISIPKQDVHSKPGGQTTSENEGDRNHLILDDLIPQVELTKLAVSQMENASDAFHADRDMHRPNVQTSAFSLSPAHRDLVLDSVKQIQDFRIEVTDSKTHSKISECCAADSLTTNTYKCLQFEDWHHVLYQIQQELVNMNIRLNIVENCISSKIYLSNCSLMDEDLVDSDDLSADSSSISDFSTEAESIASGSILHGSTNTRRFKSAGKITEHMVNLKSERGFATQADNQESKNIGHHMKSSIQSEAAASYLRNELYAIYEAFNKLHVNFSELLKELDVGICSYPKEERKEAPFELMTLRDEAGWQNNTEVFGDKKIKLADGFLTKFEEAHATVKEADIMLHALTEAYEDAKQMTVTWKQVGENLMMERESLAEENQQLKSLICHKEEENQLLKDQIHSSLIEMTNSVPMLQECFLQVQTDVEKKLTAMYSDVLLIQQDIIYIIKSLRTSVEDICSQTMEERFVSFVLSNCHVTELVNKFPFFSVNHNFQSRQGELGHSLKNCSSVESVMVTGNEELGKKGQHAVVQNLQEEQDPPHSRLMYENMALRKDLDRKEELLEGLLFDFRLLQELASNGKDIKEETEKLIVSLSQVRYELENKTSQLEDTLIQNRKLEGSLADIEKALSTSNYELRIAQDSIGKLSDENAELRELLKELYAKKSEAEEELDELKDVIKGLEKEIVNLTSSLENRSLSLLEGVEDELRKVIIERDQLHEETCILNDKLEVAYSLADEKDAIAMEARQESEASKLYAEQKEEEVKILEHSVEELECTINVLEKKVHEMEEEVGRHHLIRDSLEMKLQALKERLQAVDNLSQYADSDSTSVQQTNEPTSRQPARKITELREALNRIKLLEEEKAEQDKQIKQCKEYISEVVLHAEAQTLQYQQKYKSLESMFREVKKEISNSTSTSTALTSERTEKSSIRARGSSSPFRCISNLVQQMNQEKDQELSMARLRVEELEALAASRQKEVCMLQTRLAAAESMTHDVIRDLLGVKMDITNYASMIDQNQILKLVEDAHHLREEFLAKEKEVLNQRLLINELLEERESCKLELKTRDADILATQIGAQKLQERDQLLSAQNEMLKMDKTNLMRKVAELDDMVKTLFAARDNQQSTKIKDRGSLKLSNVEMARPRRLSQSERLLSRENNKLA